MNTSLTSLLSQSDLEQLGRNLFSLTQYDLIHGVQDFAAKGKSSASSNKPKQCQKGFACGAGCVAKTKTCKNPLQGQAKTYAGWLEMQVKAGAKLSASQQEDADALGLNKPPAKTKAKSTSKKTTAADKAKAKKEAAENAAKKTKPDGKLPDSIEGLKLVKPLDGKLAGDLMEDAAGNQFVVKRGASAEHIKSEAAADAAYRALGIPVPDSKIIETPDGPAKIAPYVQGKTFGELESVGDKSSAEIKQIVKDLNGDPSMPDLFALDAIWKDVESKVHQGFVADALLGNWNTLGNKKQSIVISPTKDGLAVLRTNNGGSLEFRAQGGSKVFDGVPVELFTMRSSSSSANAASVFGTISYKDVAEQAGKVSGLKKDLLAALPQDLHARMSQRLEAMDYIGSSYPKLAGKGATDADIEKFHRELMNNIRSGSMTLPKTAKDTDAAYKKIIGAAPGKKPELPKTPSQKVDWDKVLYTDTEAVQQAHKIYQLGDPVGISNQTLYFYSKSVAWKKKHKVPPPTDEELGAIRVYTGGSYSSLNGALRNGTSYGSVNSPKKQEALIESSKLIVSGLKQLPGYTKGNTYRGTDLSPEALAQYQAGAIVTESAFSSSAKLPGKAWSGNTHFVMIPKGKDTAAKDVEPFSMHPGEKEALWPPGAKFKVLEVKKNYLDPETGGYKLNYIVLKEV